MVHQLEHVTNLIFEGQPIKVVTRAGDQLWFVLAEVCRPLSFSNVPQTAQGLDEDEKGISKIDTLGGPQDMIIISEPGLYKLLGRSNKPEAKRFDRWVRHEVLTSIRKHGFYGSPVSAPPIQFQEISDLFDLKLDPLIRKQDEMDKKLSVVVDNTNEMAATGRKEASAETVRMHGKVVRYHFDKRCPCLECSITIMDDDGFINGAWHHHHQNNRNDNRPTAMIPLAIACHKRIEGDAEARTRFGAKAFDMFQTLLARLPVTQMKLNL